MIYLDNAATTFPKPPAVIDSLCDCLKNYCGNPSRSSHMLSLRASEAVYDTREAISRLLSIEDPENVVFTMNATYALNIAIKCIITEKCHVIISDIEHNSVIRPLKKLGRTLGVEYSVFDSDADILSELKRLKRSDTKAVITTLKSNVTGNVIDLSLLSRAARQLGLILITDASQMIGQSKIDLGLTPCDVLCAPGHKGLYGIQGCGFAVFGTPKLRDTFIEGGSGTASLSADMPEALPERLEAGTLPTPAIASLSAGIGFLLGYGEAEVAAHHKALSDRVLDILGSIKGVKAYGCGPVSFIYKNIPSSVIASELDKCGICTRGGLHCAPDTHKKLGTLNTGLVRVSFSLMNTEGELDTLYRELKRIIRIY